MSQPAFEAVHLPVIGLVVVTEHVQEAVQGEHVQLLGEGPPEAAGVALGSGNADHHVPETLIRSRPREREHVGGPVPTPVVAIEPVEQTVAGEDDRDLSRGPQGPGGATQEAAEAPGVDPPTALPVEDDDVEGTQRRHGPIAPMASRRSRPRRP
jgi:hypothetical protein